MFKTIHVPTRVCICDRCGRVISPSDYDEDQERLSIDFRGGYGSVFGDGSTVQADLCQHCVKKVLGRWLRIRPEMPHDHHPRRAFQPHQQKGGQTHG